MNERSQTHATFVLERYYPVPVERVWDAFADLEMKRQWFGTGDFVEQERREDFRVGGVAIHEAIHRKGGPLSQLRATYTDMRDNLVVPGIGTIRGFCASSHASAICAGVAFFCSAILPSRSTNA